MGFLWLSNHSQVDCGLRDHFATTIGDLWEIGGLSVAFCIQRFYNNAAKIFCILVVLYRKIACDSLEPFGRDRTLGEFGEKRGK